MSNPNEEILSNVRLVLDDEVVQGSLLIRDGRIAAMDTRGSGLPAARDGEGELILPGLVELHTDNLEKYFQPRPKVAWPERQAALAHDAQMAASGITTVFDALSVGDIGSDDLRVRKLLAMCGAVRDIVDHGLARVEHRLHLRCEVCHPDTLERFRALADLPILGLVSVMDHAPGQRQFVDFQVYRTYYQGKHGLSDAQMDDFITRRLADSQTYSERYRTAIAEECARRGLPLASHDDATLAHVAESHGHGACIAEFPTTREAASASHEHGMAVLMGAPNIVRGGSHSGNVAAMDLVRAGELDVLSSDYYPSSLLDAVFRIASAEGGYSLPRAVACATRRPAAAVGLHDRGRIAEGLRADLLRVRMQDGHPLLRRVWSEGRVVH